MGSNMQAQAVPLLKPEAPLIGTGMERRAAVDTGDVIIENAGEVTFVDAEKLVVTHGGASGDEYELDKFRRSNQGTLIHQTPIVSVGDKVKAATSWPTGHRRPAVRSRWARTAWSRSCPGRATTSRTRSSSPSGWSRTTSSPRSTSRSTRSALARPARGRGARDIPNRSESLRNLDERGIIRIGAEVQSGDLLVGKVTPKGETELTAEEKLIRAIFKEKARESATRR